MPPLKTSASDMVKNARVRIEEIETSDLITMMEDPNVVNETSLLFDEALFRFDRSYQTKVSPPQLTLPTIQHKSVYDD